MTLSTRLEPMPLSDLLAEFTALAPRDDQPIVGIGMDSRRIGPGELFLALPGRSHHGLDFYTEVKNRGAVAVLSDRPASRAINVAETCPIIVVEGLAQRIIDIVERFYRVDAEHGLSLIGVTGTDGKTSTAQYVAQLHQLTSGHPAAFMGTLGYGLLDDPFLASADGGGLLTTPDAVMVRRWIAESALRGAQMAVMEVSSHALDQDRVAQLRFAAAVLTNLGRDHLDYHGSLDAYRHAKARLFIDARPDLAVLNFDDEFGCWLAAALDAQTGTRVIGYRIAASRTVTAKPDLLTATNLRLTERGAHFDLHFADQHHQARVGLFGQFNVYNVLAAVAVLLADGFPLTDIVAQLDHLRPAPGRMERVAAGANQPTVIIDYAHTPQALEQALKALREHRSHSCRLWCVLGCGGDRDPGKRQLMGAVSARYADVRIITSDNPRTESPERIAEGILAGIGTVANTYTVLDRFRAIGQAINDAKPEDVVLIAGKGHEDYQELANGRIEFSDRRVARHWLEQAA